MRVTRTARVLGLSLCGLVCLLGVGGARQADDLRVSPSKQEYRGDSQKVQDATVTPVTLPARDLLPHLCWGDQRGTVLFAVDTRGVVHRLLVPSFKETHTLGLNR